MASPRVLLLAPTRSYRIEPFQNAAATLGAELVVGSDRCHVLSEQWGVPLALDFRDPLHAAAEALAHGPFNAVIPTDDATTIVAAEIARTLGLPANPPEAAVAARNKGRMRERLQAAGVAVPAFRILAADCLARAEPAKSAFDLLLPKSSRRATIFGSSRSANTLLAAVNEVGGFPVVLKPLLLSGSRGVIRADDAASLVVAHGRLNTILATPDHRPLSDPDLDRILVEAFVPGHEIAVEGMLRDGELTVIAIFDKPDPLDGPFFEETVYVTPASLDPATLDRVVRTVASAATALGLSRGPVHAELRLDGAACVVIEVAGRSIGGLCSRTIELATGRSLEELILTDALDQPVPTVTSTQASGVMMIPIPRRGLLRNVTGTERALLIDGVESVVITAPFDHEIVPLPEGASYLGFIFARGATPQAVERSLKAAHAALEIVITKDLLLRG